MKSSHDNQNAAQTPPAKVFPVIFLSLWLVIFLIPVVIGFSTVLPQAGKGIPWPMAIPFLLFLSLFFIVPVVVLIAAWRTYRRKSSQATSSDQPWHQHQDWAVGRIESTSQVGPALALIAFALIWNSFVGAVIYVVLFEPSTADRPPDQVLYPVLGLFALVGVGLAAGGLGMFARWKRFGKSILELKTRPGEIGGRLAGRVLARMRPAPSTEIDVALKCIERKTRRCQKRSETQETVLWQETHHLRGEQTDLAPQGSVSIPVEFVIPPECQPTTALGSEDGIYWRLDVHAKMPGPDYSAQFVVPVFVTEKSFSPEAAALQEEARRQRLSQGPPPQLSVRISPTMSGGTQIDWPPNRRPLVSLAFFVVAVALALAAWFAFHKAGIVPGAVVGLFAALVALAAWGAAMSWSRLELEPDGTVRIWQKMFRSKLTECSAHEVRTVERLAGGQAGKTPFFYLSIRLADGRQFKLGTGMEGEEETAYLEALVEDWLEHQRRRHSTRPARE